ncbi:hypothetical protein [Nostoc sp.]
MSTVFASFPVSDWECLSLGLPPLFTGGRAAFELHFPKRGFKGVSA